MWFLQDRRQRKEGYFIVLILIFQQENKESLREILWQSIRSLSSSLLRSRSWDIHFKNLTQASTEGLLAACSIAMSVCSQ